MSINNKALPRLAAQDITIRDHTKTAGHVGGFTEQDLPEKEDRINARVPVKLHC